jgi:DNA-binding HxlR family transcriptional regulator
MPHVTEEGERAGAVGSRSPRPGCCPHLHEAVELVGRRWTGAIIEVLRQAPRPLRFSEIAQAIPDLSDRLCSERMKELEQRGLVERRVHTGPPVRVTYALTPMGEALGPALGELKTWAQQWLAGPEVHPHGTGGRPEID